MNWRNFSMQIGSAAFAISVLAQAPTIAPLPTIPVPEIDHYVKGPPRPTREEFLSRIQYPYRAAPHQRRRIQRAARMVRVGWTEPEVLKLLGPPDYKAKWLHDVGQPKKAVLDEVWHYVHTMKQVPRYDEPGLILTISLSNRSKPRRVVAVESVGLPREKRR